MKPLLLEIGSEELPPTALLSLTTAFAKGVVSGLAAAGLSGENGGELSYQQFATPRRMAIRIENIADTAPDQEIEKLGPNVKAAFDSEGQATKAALGFASGCGVTVEQLERKDTDKGERLMFVSREPGLALADLLQQVLDDVLAKLPIPKRMRWAARRDEFIRPVKWLLALHGGEVLPLQAFGVQAGNTTRGHRFMGGGDQTLAIANAEDYEQRLKEEGKVIADYEGRKQLIAEQLETLGKTLNGEVVVEAALLDEVCSLVEWPHCLAGKFDTEFLELPDEALISSMRSHQKYFHVLDSSGALMPHFVTVSNIDSKDPQQVVDGNERVIRPRLADAQFFYANDGKQGLQAMAARLGSIVFQDKLGSVADKAARVGKIAQFIGDQASRDFSASDAFAARAAELCKADLVSDMVGEFADLQGTMGRYYAVNEGEPDDVASAIEEHYLPRHAGDRLPASDTGARLSLADRLDTLVGIFGIGQAPTGSKDPFALRRASLGLLRVLVEKNIDLNLRPVIEFAIAQHKELSEPDLGNKVLAYVLDRLRGWYADQQIATEIVQAVLNTGSDNPLDIDQRMHAVSAFSKLEQAEALAAANKRVKNLLSKQGDGLSATLDNSLLKEPAEQALAEQLAAMKTATVPLLSERRYSEALQTLAGLKEPVDAFFDSVMVMDEDLALRNNRLALLQQLGDVFGQIADISQLAQ